MTNRITGRRRATETRLRLTDTEKSELYARKAASGQRTLTDFVLACARLQSLPPTDQALLAALSGCAAALASQAGSLNDLCAQLSEVESRLMRLSAQSPEASDALHLAEQTVAMVSQVVGRVEADSIAVRRDLRLAVAPLVAPLARAKTLKQSGAPNGVLDGVSNGA